MLVIEAPLESTYFLLVTDKLAEVLPWGAQVSLQDVVVATTSADNRLVPSDGADSLLMAKEVSHQPAVLGVPDLGLSRVSAHSEMGSMLGPSY